MGEERRADTPPLALQGSAPRHHPDGGSGRCAADGTCTKVDESADTVFVISFLFVYVSFTSFFCAGVLAPLDAVC